MRTEKCFYVKTTNDSFLTLWIWKIRITMDSQVFVQIVTKHYIWEWTESFQISNLLSLTKMWQQNFLNRQNSKYLFWNNDDFFDCLFQGYQTYPIIYYFLLFVKLDLMINDYSQFYINIFYTNNLSSK